MGFLGALKKGLGAGFKTVSAESMKEKYGGNKDFLEAVCASAALIAAADGEVEDAEVESILEACKTNDKLAAAYKQHEVEEVLTKMLTKAKTRAGKMSLKRELGDVTDHQMKEDVFLMALDVAESDGQIEDAEKPVLLEIAGIYGLDPKKYGL